MLWRSLLYHGCPLEWFVVSRNLANPPAAGAEAKRAVFRELWCYEQYSSNLVAWLTSGEVAHFVP